MILQEISVKTILSKSKVADYAINPYVGCEHGCTYCYARFMKRVTGHREPWGTFVDVKANAAALLGQEIAKKPRGRVWISGVCDPYQPTEAQYRLTRRCLEILARYDWPVTLQTKSPLVVRDLDLLRTFNSVEAGCSLATADERIRGIFEPHAPSIADRVDALAQLHTAGVTTYAMIAPLLPGAEGLVALLKDTVDYVLIDRMNYHYADWVYRKHGLEYARTDRFLAEKRNALSRAFDRNATPYRLLF
jgi:DNA repair photolyase